MDRRNNGSGRMMIPVHPEHWKYTSLRGLSDFAFLSPKNNPSFTVPIPDVPFKTSGRVVFVDGHYSPAHSHFPAEITVQMILAAFPEDNPFIQHLKPTLSEGVEIRVTAHQRIIDPLDCVFVFTEDAEACAAHLHHRIHFEQGSVAALVMRYLGLSDLVGYVANVHTDIVMEAGANGTVYHLQQQGKKAYHVESIRTQQASHATLTMHSLSVGALLSRIEFDAQYHDAHASSLFYGIYHVSGRQHVDYHLNGEHNVAWGSTQQHVKGCVNDEARAVFNGRVAVKPHAVKAQSAQSHHGLLLSKRARIDAKPELEIDCDDVQCRHGATVGAIRQDALFYLTARGIPEKQARVMLELAHVSSLLSHVSRDDIRDHLEKILVSAAWSDEAPHV